MEEKKDRESRVEVCRKCPKNFGERIIALWNMEIQNGGINPEDTMLSTQRTPLHNGLCVTEKDDFNVHDRMEKACDPILDRRVDKIVCYWRIYPPFRSASLRGNGSPDRRIGN